MTRKKVKKQLKSMRQNILSVSEISNFKAHQNNFVGF